MTNVKTSAWYGSARLMTPGCLVGDVFYVDGVAGSDAATNPGTDPAEPLLTIKQAMSLCTDDEDDVVIVLNYPENVAVAGEDEPIVIDKNRVHVLVKGCFLCEPTKVFEDGV